MDKFGRFLNELRVYSGTRLDKAVLIIAAAKTFKDESTLTIKIVCDYFEEAHLARPNPSILSRSLTNDRRVSNRQKSLRALAAADRFLEETYPEITAAPEPKPGSLRADVSINLKRTPLIDEGYVEDLEHMLELYATLHTLENSMRRLIEKVLVGTLGSDWWDKAASTPHKKKHEDRLSKERDRKWLPARASLGPLYSLDWSDLISIIRRYEADFLPYIGEIDFMHRFVDLGLIRHVVAHHGFIDEPKDYERVKLALYDWQKQVTAALLQGA